MHRQQHQTAKALTILEDIERRRSGTDIGADALWAMIGMCGYLRDFEAERNLSLRMQSVYHRSSMTQLARENLNAMEVSLYAYEPANPYFVRHPASQEVISGAAKIRTSLGENQ
jgi:hypothetical protein